MGTTTKSTRRTMYLHDGYHVLYVGEMKGDDFDIYEVKGKGPRLTRVMICSCQVGDDDRTEYSGERILIRHLPIGYIPPLLLSKNKLVKDYALARLSHAL